MDDWESNLQINSKSLSNGLENSPAPGTKPLVFGGLCTF